MTDGLGNVTSYAYDILGHRLIGFAPLAWRDTWRIGKEAIVVQPRLLTNNSESLRTAVLAGLGLAAVPEWLVADGVQVTEGQTPNPEWRAKLASLSGKFQKVGDRAGQWVATRNCTATAISETCA